MRGERERELVRRLYGKGATMAWKVDNEKLTEWKGMEKAISPVNNYAN